MSVGAQFSINLSKATRLTDVAFRFLLNPQWVTTTLRTVTPDHRGLRQISLDFSIGARFQYANPGGAEEAVRTQWSELDHLLTQLWESHSIRPKVLYNIPPQRARIRVGALLPETMTRGIVDLVERDHRL
jgi:hypothetical protein